MTLLQLSRKLLHGMLGIIKTNGRFYYDVIIVVVKVTTAWNVGN